MGPVAERQRCGCGSCHFWMYERVWSGTQWCGTASAECTKTASNFENFQNLRLRNAESQWDLFLFTFHISWNVDSEYICAFRVEDGCSESSKLLKQAEISTKIRVPDIRSMLVIIEMNMTWKHHQETLWTRGGDGVSGTDSGRKPKLRIVADRKKDSLLPFLRKLGRFGSKMVIRKVGISEEDFYSWEREWSDLNI